MEIFLGGAGLVLLDLSSFGFTSASTFLMLFKFSFLAYGGGYDPPRRGDFFLAAGSSFFFLALGALDFYFPLFVISFASCIGGTWGVLVFSFTLGTVGFVCSYYCLRYSATIFFRS